MAAINLPAFCSVCDTIYPSGFVVDNLKNATFKNNSVRCPNGHMGKVMDGTFDVYDGVMTFFSKGDVTEEILHKLRALGNEAATGSKPPEAALDEMLTLVPSDVAAVIKKFSGNRPPMVTILVILYHLAMFTAAGAGIYSSFVKNDQAITYNQNTIINNFAPTDTRSDRVDKPFNRSETRKRESMERKKKKAEGRRNKSHNEI